MQLLVKILIGAIVLSGAYVWIFKERQLFARASTERESAAAGIALPTDTKEFRGEGVLMAYEGNGSPVFYLLTETAKHRFLRKELRFTRGTGCSPRAGDLPCTPMVWDTNTPPVPVGSFVYVTGTLNDQRILVDTLEQRSDARGTFELVIAEAGETRQSGAIATQVRSIHWSDGCTLYVGCYDDDVPQATIAFDIGKGVAEKTVIPGMIIETKEGVIALLWADPDRGEAAYIIGHGKGR